MGALPLDTLDSINEQLEGVISLLDGYQDELQSLVDQNNAEAQAKINARMEEISNRISEKLKPIKNKAENALKPPLEKAKVIIQPIETLMGLVPPTISLDVGCLTAIVDILVEMFNIIKKPYEPLMELVTQVPTKVATLNSNISAIANYQISVDTSKSSLTVPPLSIQIDPISV